MFACRLTFFSGEDRNSVSERAAFQVIATGGTFAL